MFSSIANQDVMKTDILLYRQQCLFSHGGKEGNLDQFGNKISICASRIRHSKVQMGSS